jgi:hypothetical protein
MLLGIMLVDGSMVLLGAGTGNLMGRRGEIALNVMLSAILAAIGGWLLFQGITA